MIELIVPCLLLLALVVFFVCAGICWILNRFGWIGEFGRRRTGAESEHDPRRSGKTKGGAA